MSAGGEPVPPVDRCDDRAQARQQEDRLVLAPPGADIDHCGMEKDGGRAHDGPAGPVPEREDDDRGQSEIGEGRRQLHQRPDARIRRVGHRCKGRLDRRQHRPDVGHDRSEGDRSEGGPAVQRRQPVVGDVMHPPHELIDVSTQAVGREEDQPDQDSRDHHTREREAITPRPWCR